jgi:rubrerythrin
VNGKAFYEEAAQKTADPGVRSLCKELAEWEARHVSHFEAMRRALPDSAREGATFDPDSELAGYVRAAADEHVFLQNKDVGELVAACRSSLDLLELAIRFEKDSVRFYEAMKELVAAHLGQVNLDSLIDEELRHIAALSRERESLAS